MGRKTIIFSEFKKRFDNVSKGEYEYISGYRSMSQKIEIKHISCGHVFTPIATAFINTGTGCPKCNHSDNLGLLKKTTEDYKKEIEDITNGEYTITSKYINAITDITFLHNTCGQTYESKPRNFTSGNRCPYCNRRSYPYTIEELQEISDLKYKDIKIISYDASNRIIEYKCLICETVKKSDLTNFKKGLDFLERKICCKKQQLIKDKLHNKLMNIFNKRLKEKQKEESKQAKVKELINKVYEIHGDEIVIIECESTNRQYPLIAKCNKCGDLFISKFKYLLDGKSCPNCKISKGERKVKLYLDRHSINYIREYSFKDDLEYIKNLRFDFAIFKNNTLSCLIEYDGEQHFNSSVTFGSSKNNEIEFQETVDRDNKKNEYCKQINIPLLRIPYTDFNNVESILDKFLNH